MMSSKRITPSTPEQAQQVIDELAGILAREPGTPGVHRSEYPHIPQSAMPRFIVDRYIIPSFELQLPVAETDRPYFGVNSQDDLRNPVAQVGFGREFITPSVRALTIVSYNVVKTTSRARRQLGLEVATSFDIGHLSPQPEGEQFGGPADAEGFKDIPAEERAVILDHLWRPFDTPTVEELELTEAQKRLQEPSPVACEEADLLIRFLHNLYS